MKFDDIDESDQMIGFHNVHECDVTNEQNVDLYRTYIHNSLLPLEINKLHNLPNLGSHCTLLGFFKLKFLLQN
jgi:hypothetical protein